MASEAAVWEVLIYLLGAYLLGSIPTAYLAGRWLKGIDIRQFGSGNVGGSNVWNNVARWALVPVAIFDISKAVVTTGLALYVFDLGYGVAVTAGLVTAAGHAWSIFLSFTGGRALSCILGTLIVVFPWGALVLVGIIITGYILKNTAGSSIGLIVLPPLSFAFGNPPAVTWGCIGMIVLTAMKRLEGNRAPLPSGKDRWSVILRRLWQDRDMADHDEWLTRRPPSSSI